MTLLTYNSRWRDWGGGGLHVRRRALGHQGATRSAKVKLRAPREHLGDPGRHKSGDTLETHPCRGLWEDPREGKQVMADWRSQGPLGIKLRLERDD